MGHTTDELIKLAKEVCDNPPKREMDQLLATGEQVTIALMAMAIHGQGHEAISFTGGQIGLVTDNSFSKARIQSINHQRILDQLSAGKIVIIAGFQGITPEGDMTTLGRGGSNATLVAIGAVLEADVCENYTDVDGIFTADPRLVKNAVKIERISYDEMLELSGLSASVLQTRAVEFAKKYNVPIHVRNSQNEKRRHLDHRGDKSHGTHRRLRRCPQKRAHPCHAQIRPRSPGRGRENFGEIAEANIVVDDIIQNVMDDNTANISFTVEHGDLQDIKPVVDKLDQRPGSQNRAHLSRRSGQSKCGRRRHARPHGSRPAHVLALPVDAKINIQNITTSEIKISCIIAKDDGDKALQLVHDAFELEKVK